MSPRDLERILTEEVMAMIRPKRLHVLCKGETFDKINLREKNFVVIKSSYFIPSQSQSYAISFDIEKQLWKLSSDFKTLQFSDYDNYQSDITPIGLEIILKMFPIK